MIKKRTYCGKLGHTVSPEGKQGAGLFGKGGPICCFPLWRRQNSNLRPIDYKSIALTS